MYLRILLPLAVAIGAASASQAAIIVTAGNHVLQPNTPGQAINILITATAGEAVHSMDFTAGINGAVAPAPIIAAMDINGAGTLFDTNVNTSMVFTFGPGFDPPGLEVLERVEFDSDDLDVPIGTNQLLAQLIIDTTDFAAGQWAFDLLHTGFDQLSLFAIEEGLPVALPVTLVSGTITIVPEPASWALCCLSLCALVLCHSQNFGCHWLCQCLICLYAMPLHGQSPWHTTRKPGSDNALVATNAAGRRRSAQCATA